MRFVTLTFGGWDFHSSLEKGMKRVLPILDATVSTLIEDLERRGLLDSTIVMVMGEFGRTPRMNKKGVPGSDPVPGRDHWGKVMSVLVAGGGFARGRVIGSSSARGEYPRSRPLRPQDLMTTLYHAARDRSRDHLHQPRRPADQDRLQWRADQGPDGLIALRWTIRPGFVPDRAVDFLVERRAAGGELAQSRCAWTASGPCSS